MHTNERELIALAKDARRFNSIPAELIPFFNQHGNWIGAPWAWSKSTIHSTAHSMRGLILPARQRFRRSGVRRIVLTSLEIKQPTISRWDEVHGNVLIDDGIEWEDGQIDFIQGSLMAGRKATIKLPRLEAVVGDFRTHILRPCRIDVPQLLQIGGSAAMRCKLPPRLEHVGGNLRLHHNRAVSLQALESVGGTLEIIGSRGVRADELISIGGDLRLPCSNLFFHAEKLREVGGTLMATKVIVFIAPDLVRVGGDADTRSAHQFGPRKLRVDGNWHAHPSVNAHMAACARACKILGTSNNVIKL